MHAPSCGGLLAHLLIRCKQKHTESCTKITAEHLKQVVQELHHVLEGVAEDAAHIAEHVLHNNSTTHCSVSDEQQMRDTETKHVAD